VRFNISDEEILETWRMVEVEKLDIRTITMGINILDCRKEDAGKTGQAIYDKICNKARNLVAVGKGIQRDFGIPIINQRISVTPIALLVDGFTKEQIIEIGQYLDRAAREVGVNFLGGLAPWSTRAIPREHWNWCGPFPRLWPAPNTYVLRLMWEQLRRALIWMPFMIWVK
jgi:uncharacterized protein (UPF0210 family)